MAGTLSLSNEPADADVVKAMCDLLRHRGPDDEGLWSSGPVALGHRRLSIIDLSPRGRNPLANEDGDVFVCCNGEIYNYRELRQDLVSRGHRFRSETDVESIVHLYEEEGVEAVRRLDGMFAFALYDVRRRRLLLARDRFGVKPLYYTRFGNTLAFASEIKAFLALPGFAAKLDARGLAEHFAFQNQFGSRTLFEGVSLLPAGHMLIAEDGAISTRQYWDLDLDPQPNMTLEDWAQGLRERFEAAVTRQLMSDVPLGSFLSGGMDTGSISAVAARSIRGMHTFTCGFALPAGRSDLEKYFDERRESHELAAHLGTIHHELELGPDAMAPLLPQVVWHLDEPRVGISYPVIRTAQMIREHVTVVLSGVGGDELFAGYPWRYDRAANLDGEAFDVAYYREWCRLLSDEERSELFTQETRRAIGDFTPYDSFREAIRGARASGGLSRALYFDFKTFMNGLLLVDDRLTMAHSLESRVPFLDNELVAYTARIPPEHKGRKLVLRRAMQGLVPDATLNRRKQGFTPPDRTWYKGELLATVKDLVLGRDRGVFERRALERILDEHLSDKRDHRFLLWSLMSIEWWHRLFVDREPLPEREI
ncbi:MAG TPA: asparagine synthase (glutamine-hydrolyzing) [Polyangiaceae bacterium]|nr:asparagine synthase (glutamine-hydrolyzing) [Polyangiaceae bacterium]